MTKEQKLFWDLLSGNYPHKKQRSCRNCINNTDEGFAHGYNDSEICQRCRNAGANDYHTVWEWDGTMI